MELLGEQLISASRQAVWNALNDPDVLARCIPGCEEITRLSENQLQVRLMVKMGPVRSRFAGTLTLEDINAPASCSLVFEGTGAAGFAKGGSTVVLTDQGLHTRLEYAAKASIGGKLGQIGGRLIESSARKMADEFFSAFQGVVSGDATAGAASGATQKPSQPQGLTPDNASHGSGGQDQSQAAQAVSPTVQVPVPEFAERPRGADMAGWRPELYRAFWFCLGVFFTLLVSRWLP